MTLFESAISFAVGVHAGQTRKGKGRPYILHLLEAASIVGAYTVDEEVLAAAVLHDSIEDAGVTKEEIAGMFGDRVAGIVEAESEDKMRDVPAADSWMSRKMATVGKLRNESRDVKLVCLGDKLANVREIYEDYLKDGDSLWEKFNQKNKKMHEWYYGSIFDILKDEFGDIPAMIEYGELLRKIFG